MSSASPILGIDLGTTNSLVAVAHFPGPSPPRILTGREGQAMLPSVVRFDGAGRVVEVGESAKRNAIAHPRSTVSSVKRLMGRSIRDAAPDQPYLSVAIVAGPQDTARIALPLDDGGAKIVSPQEVSAIILRTLKEQAERALGVPVQRAVVTVPAYFDDAQRQATRDAGRLAGLEVVRIVNEPTAAALAYGLGLREAAHARDEASESRGLQPSIVIVYDLGGGTFDVSILRITPASAGDANTNASPADFFQVLSTAGDTHLGGDDFDHLLVDLFTQEIRAKIGGSGTLDFPPETRQALGHFAERTKVRLSESDRASLRIDLGEGRIYERTITRDEFESLAAPLVERTIACCNRALRDARRQIGQEPISAVILVGGATRTPLVRRRVAEVFGITPYTALNPDEVVALGAAVQASVLAGSASSGGNKSLLLDVVPLSLGLETVGGAMAKLIVRNSTVPARAGEMFSTSVDNQTGIVLNVLQGEREMAADCRSLGRYELKGIPPMPAGIPKLRVEFLVDASGILTVQAVEQRSGKRLEAQIVPNHGLTREEVDRIERESFTHAREDMTRHRVTDLITNAKLDLHWIGKQMERVGAELPADVRAEIETRTATLKGFVDRATADFRSVDADAFYKAKEALDQASMRLHEVAITRSLRDDPPTPPAARG